jgi:hypothetical protein
MTSEEIHDAAIEILSLRREVDKLRDVADRIAPYLRWTISEESPGYHPTMPSAVAAFHEAFGIETAEKRLARIKGRNTNERT